MTRAALAPAICAVLVAGACGEDPGESIDEITEAARDQFPDLARLYAGDQGMYRGCGPNGGVCHNGNEYPNLDSIGSIVDNIGRDCNQKRGDRPETMHDMCERPGDRIEVGDTTAPRIEVAWFEPVDQAVPPRAWKMKLRGAPAMVPQWDDLQLFRGETIVFHVGYYMTAMAPDPADPTGTTIAIQLAPPPPNPADFDAGAYMSARFAAAGNHADPVQISTGDPNRNGTFGAELGGKIIKPGDPQRSYLLRRLTDPNAGPLMPRANCCYWTKPALRALWCWVAGLDATGSNALAAIDYDACPPSPSVDLLYPEPGPACEGAGLCPIEAAGDPNEPTFPSIYTNILVPKCGGEGCHDREPAGYVDMRSEQAAYDTLMPKLVPFDPASSILYQRLFEATCPAPCRTMPLGRPVLPDEDREMIRQWIADGALREPPPP